MKLDLSGVRLPLAPFVLAADVTLSSRVAAVCGPSGAGKTSLLELIAGVRRPRAGRIAFAGEVFDDASARLHLPPPARRLGYVPQEGALFPHLDVRANLFYGASRATPDSPAPARVIAVLELAPLLARSVAGLSGGERQRVALGRALLSGPRLLLLDEPLANLDAPLRRRILDYLSRIRDELRVPMLYVTHDADDVAALAEEIVVLERGRVVAQGHAAELLERDPDAMRLRPQPGDPRQIEG